MTSRLAQTVVAATAVLALALPAGAQARHGADDQPGHVRHSVAEVHHHHHARHHAHHTGSTVRHGADDGPNHR
jgi:hypothetical protein